MHSLRIPKSKVLKASHVYWYVLPFHLVQSASTEFM